MVFFATCDSVDYHCLLLREAGWPVKMDDADRILGEAAESTAAPTADSHRSAADNILATGKLVSGNGRGGKSAGVTRPGGEGGASGGAAGFEFSASKQQFLEPLDCKVSGGISLKLFLCRKLLE